jgi:hypothetical protein
MTETKTTERVWVQPDPEQGYVNIKQGNITLARTKSLNVARRIRDALNAPETLVGQTVEIDRAVTINMDNEVLAREVVRGVVMTLVPWGRTHAFLLRLPDNTLKTVPIDDDRDTARIVEPDAPEPVTWEP